MGQSSLYQKACFTQDAGKAFTPGRLESGEKLKYGYGWNISGYRGFRRVWHGGSTCGFRTAILRFPDEKFSVIVLTNRRKADTNWLAEQLTDIFLNGDEK